MTSSALLLVLGTLFSASTLHPGHGDAHAGNGAHSDPVWTLATPILKLACASRVTEGAVGSTEADLDRALDTLFHQEDAAADEALVILLNFYIGESRGTDVWENVVDRGSRMMPLLKKYRTHPKELPSVKCKTRIRLTSDSATEALDSAMLAISSAEQKPPS